VRPARAERADERRQRRARPPELERRDHFGVSAPPPAGAVPPPPVAGGVDGVVEVLGVVLPESPQPASIGRASTAAAKAVRNAVRIIIAFPPVSLPGAFGPILERRARSGRTSNTGRRPVSVERSWRARYRSRAPEATPCRRKDRGGNAARRGSDQVSCRRGRGWSRREVSRR
jgi:hypothetical protein